MAHNPYSMPLSGGRCFHVIFLHRSSQHACIVRRICKCISTIMVGICSGWLEFSFAHRTNWVGIMPKAPHVLSKGIALALFIIWGFMEFADHQFGQESILLLGIPCCESMPFRFLSASFLICAVLGQQVIGCIQSSGCPHISHLPSCGGLRYLLVRWGWFFMRSSIICFS